MRCKCHSLLPSRGSSLILIDQTAGLGLWQGSGEGTTFTAIHALLHFIAAMTGGLCRLVHRVDQG